MFLEVYVVPYDNYSDKTKDIKIEENRRLIETTGIRIRHSSRFKDRAEIVLADKAIIHVAGSMEEITQRLSRANIVAHI